MAGRNEGTGRSLVIDVVNGFPATEEADLLALRRMQATRLGLRRVTRLQAALPSASYEQLARRSVSRGEPFAL